MMKDVVKTLTGLISEMQKMGVTCFPASDLAMALPAYAMYMCSPNDKL